MPEEWTLPTGLTTCEDYHSSILEDVVVYNADRTPFIFRHYANGCVDAFRGDGSAALYSDVKWVFDLIDGVVVTWETLDRVFRRLERITIVKRYPYRGLIGTPNTEKYFFEPEEELPEDLPTDAWTLFLTEGAT